MSGKMVDINTGRIIGEVKDPAYEFGVYIFKVRKKRGTNNHIRYGRNTMLRARQFINKLRDEGVECILDRTLPSDSCILVDGTPREWDEIVQGKLPPEGR